MCRRCVSSQGSNRRRNGQQTSSIVPGKRAQLFSYSKFVLLPMQYGVPTHCSHLLENSKLRLSDYFFKCFFIVQCEKLKYVTKKLSRRNKETVKGSITSLARFFYSKTVLLLPK